MPSSVRFTGWAFRPCDTGARDNGTYQFGLVTRETSTPNVGTGRARLRETDLDEIKDQVVPEPILSAEERASVLHLTEHTCKWPVGDPGTTDFHFCGARTKTGSPYCATHAAMAYQPLERRRRKSGPINRIFDFES